MEPRGKGFLVKCHYCYILEAFLKDEPQCRTNLNKYGTQTIIIANWVSIG